MRIILKEDSASAGQFVAGLIMGVVHENPHAVIGVATGSSPVPVYEALRRRGADLSTATAVALDEYVGLNPDHPQSYRRFLSTHLAEPLGMDRHRLLVPDGSAPNAAATAAQYEVLLDELGGADVQLLGIGRNGHIGFNEPGSRFESLTRVVRLTDDTRKANARFFESPDDVPREAISQGLGTITRARQLVLIATTEDKAEAVARAVHGPVDPATPASILQRHPAATIVLTSEAASLLKSGHLPNASISPHSYCEE
jgi:glucosamine-6-phosphate deaminase